MINFKFNLTFHNVLTYNRAIFNDSLVCSVDFANESWQPVEASCKEFHKINILKISTNHNT